MDHALTRRGLLGGIGAAAGAVALGAATSTGLAAAAPGVPAAPTGDAQSVDPAADVLLPGLTYQMVDAVAFTPRDNDQAWQRRVTAAGADLETGGALVAPLVMPVGAVLRQVTFFYASPSATEPQVVNVKRKPLAGAYFDIVPPATLPQGTGLLSFTVSLTEPVTGNATYSVFVNTTDFSQVVGGVRYGYAPPPQAFVALTGVPRYDTRTGAGKLKPGEERIVNVGVPAAASAAVINLTVTETEAAGFVAAFRADIAWPGNSSINWSSPNQNIANGVICPVDATGSIKIRGGVAPTHVVIDSEGYLL
jgi:hypothetical protein